jgi:NADPH2 dehydrogenase
MIMMSYLNKPLENGKLALKNRLVMPPMATAKSEEDGAINQAILNYYDEKSKGGYLSLIIIEHSFVSRQGKAGDRQLSVAENRLVEDLKKLADTIHKNGSKTVMQINHAGSAAREEVTGMEPVGPSAVLNPPKGEAVPIALDISEIKAIVNDFKEAAIRVKNARFDGVEIHCAHGYLLSQFLSPITNKRTDKYGGDITGRMKIHLEIIRAIREAAGVAFPILLRLGAADYMDGGLTIEDSKTAAQAFEKAGVDMLDISGGFCRFTIPGVDEPGYFSLLSKAIKEVVSIPVIVTGGITKADEADNILRDKKADLIGVGRAIYKDSNWAKNAMESVGDK